VHAATARPLHGVPLALKDNLDTAGIPPRAARPRCAPMRRRARGGRAAPVDAGAIVFGKAEPARARLRHHHNNAAFGPRATRTTAAHPRRSSGGTAWPSRRAMVPGGIGSDTGGSVRIPAALCGIVGLPAHTGRWSQAGIVPSPTRATRPGR
jgi:mandelamide amidase